MKAVRLGIDFGTTRTVVACADRGNYPVVAFEGEGGDTLDWFPSIIAARGDELRYGLEAATVADDPAWTLVRSFKRLLGEETMTPETTVDVAGVRRRVSDVVTGFLVALRHAVLERSNLPSAARKRAGATVQAFVATPANSLGAQRFMTIEAFRAAGFDVIGMLNEPSAAGFEYTHRHRATLSAKREHVVVYDLGGGTFDASLVRMSGGDHEVVTTGGLARLGGDDFDDVLVECALAAAKKTRADLDARGLALLTEACRDAKERLTPNAKRVTIESADLDAVTVDVAAYYDACAPLVERTIDAMRPVMGQLEAGAGDELSSIAGIYVVGGASALPIVGRALRERFGRRVHRSPYPSAATAVGLAIATDDDATARYRLADKFSRHFGVFREERSGQVISFDPIFTRDTALPGAGGDRVTVRRTYRAAHNVGHYRFVECSGLDERGTPQGRISRVADVRFPFSGAARATERLDAVPVERAEPGAEVCEEYSLDANGLVALTITDRASGFKASYELGRLL